MPYRGPAARSGGQRSKQVWWAYGGIRRGALGVVAAWLILSPLDAAFAACDPDSGTASAFGIPAICTGATVNQGGGPPGTSAGASGYGTGVETNLNVTVVPGASVTGFGSRGLSFFDGTVFNSGTITGSTSGIGA